MGSPVASQPVGAAMAGQQETILIVGSQRRQIHRLRHELQSSGYLLLAAEATLDAVKLLTTQPVQLVIVNASGSGRFPEGEISDRVGKSPGKQEPAVKAKEQEGYELCQSVEPAARQSGVPILLIGSVWGEAVLVRALETRADYFLFAPYQEQDLLRAIREALLNGPVAEPAEVSPGVAVIHLDRTYVVTAGRTRLARLAFSVLEELRQCRAALSWSQADALDLRQQLRQERRHSERAQQLPVLVQGIAHDFSNLLETVGAATTVLRSGPSHPQPYREAMDAALSQAAMLNATLQNWAEWEEEGSNIEAVDLAAAAREVLDATLLPLRAPNIRVRLQMHGIPPVTSSRPLLVRILSNLVWNAVEAMPTGGMLSLQGYLRRNRVALEVSDTGVGISEKDQERIFTPHFTTKQGHAGIGLHLVRSLVQRAGGEMTFASHPGRGSTFAFSFPVAQLEDSAAHPPQGIPRMAAE